MWDVVDKAALEKVLLGFFLSDNHYSSNAPHSFVWHLGMESGLIEDPVPKNVAAFHTKIRKRKLQALEFMVKC